MELRHLRYFIAVAEMGNVSRAAERLFIAQPPLSLQIKQLEDEIGVPLLLRYARGVHLTAAGTSFLAEAKAIIARADRAKRMAGHMDDVSGGFVRIGYVQSAGHTLLPRLVRRLRSQRPAVDLEVREMNTAMQLRALHDGEIDVGLARPPVRSGRVTLAAQMVDPCCLALPDDHALARERGPIDLEAVADEAFVSVQRHSGPAFFDLTIGACTQAGFNPHIRYEVNTVASLLDLVAAGLGVAIVQASCGTRPASGYVLRALSRPTRASSLALAHAPGDTNPIVALLATLARPVFEELSVDIRRAIVGVH